MNAGRGGRARCRPKFWPAEREALNTRYLLCLVITIISGAAALTHELLWTRRLVDILGATGTATSIVLGCFFFGLSAGAALASRRVDGISKPWRALAIVELAIALLTLPAAMLPTMTDWIWPVLGPTALTAWPGKLVKLTVAASVVIPPAVAMGITLPLLIVAMEKTITQKRSAKVWVYAFNTLGGACGLLVTSVWLLGNLGVFGCMLLALATNVIVAGLAWSMQSSKFWLLQPKRRQAQPAKQPVGLTDRLRFFLAAFSGFSVLALEIVAIRMLSLVVPSSFQATSSVLLSVILLLGIAALVAPLIEIAIAARRWQLSLVLAISAAGSALAPWLLHNRTSQLVNVSALAAMNGKAIGSALDFQLSVISITILSIGLSLFFAGLVFPFLFASVPQDHKSSSGKHWALLLAINGLGGLVGAMLAEYGLLPTFGIYGSMVLLGVIQALAGLAFAAALADWKVAIPPAAAALACVLLVPLTLKLPYITPKSVRKFEVESVQFGKDGVCLVTESEGRDRGILMNNQYVLGSTNALHEQRRQVFIPLLLHQAVANHNSQRKTQVCCLGLATGMSAGAALDFDDECQVTAIELSSMVVDAARNHFAEENRGVVTDPRATIVVEDARTYISSVNNAYDVIAGDLYRPYGAGEGRLFSLEHFQNVRRALREGGIYCQWIPAYQVTETQFAMIAATFMKAFPDAALLCVDSESGYPQLGLMGTKNAEISWTTVATRCADLAARLDDPRLREPEFLKSTYVGRLSKRYCNSEVLNTLDNARLEIMAGLHKVTLDPRAARGRVDKDAYLQGENWKAFLQKRNQFTSSSPSDP